LEEAGEYDITIEQGSGFSLPLTYEAPEGSFVDFTGSTARLHVRSKYGATETLIELTTENGGIELTEDGEITLSVSAEDTAALTFSRGVTTWRSYRRRGSPTRSSKATCSSSVRSRDEPRKSSSRKAWSVLSRSAYRDHPVSESAGNM
jgi:hypothetical protein